jgi:hypothetical protein
VTIFGSFGITFFTALPRFPVGWMVIYFSHFCIKKEMKKINELDGNKVPEE